MTELSLPHFYVVASKLTDEEITDVGSALSITPCTHAIISSFSDRNLAMQFCTDVIHIDTDKNALMFASELATTLRRPVLVVGNADVLDAVYVDGSRQNVIARSQAGRFSL